MIKLDSSFYSLFLQVFLATFFHFLLIQDTVETFRTSQGTLQLSKNRGDVIEGFGILIDIDEKGHQLANSKASTR